MEKMLPSYFLNIGPNSEKCSFKSMQTTLRMGLYLFEFLNSTSVKSTNSQGSVSLNLKNKGLQVNQSQWLHSFIIFEFIIEQMTMTATQFNRNCLNFVNVLEKSDSYEGVKQLLTEWRANNKPASGAIDTFMKMIHILKEDEEIVDEFNRCLSKEATILKKPASNQQVKEMAMENSNSALVLDSVYNWLQKDQIEKAPLQTAAVPVVAPAGNPQKIEELTEQELMAHLESHRFSAEIGKILSLYRRCIITLKEFKSFIEPIYLTDPSAFNMLFQYAEELEESRRKITIFAPLTDLVDQKYPVEQVGNSYIIIPDGYANYSHTWSRDPMVKELNRICCSVPLGSEGSFVISRKNEYEEQLFKNEEEKYEIDHNICLIKGGISSIEKGKNLNTSLLRKLLIKIYPQENVFNIMIGQSEIAKEIILPRLKQKLAELMKCKAKFQKQCEDVANKNYFKSLDYRCFYFRKNDKKFNCTQRWDKEIELRKKQILEGIENYEEQITDREALQTTRNHALNSFENITKESLLQDRKIDLGHYDRKKQAHYPPYPGNQILFLLDFEDQDVFNDVLEVILFHCQKKSILELIVLRMFKKVITKRLTKDSKILNFIDSKTSSASTTANQNNENFQSNSLTSGSHNRSEEPLNETKKEKKIFKDITQQFLDLIEEQIQPLQTQEIPNPFEGPDEHTFIGTKTVYSFVRYLLAIYQRFLKAKQMSDEKSKNEKDLGCSIYSQFLTIMIFKLKDAKLFEEYLRKISTHEAFVFFTLDKFITSLVKLVNNINSDCLTYKILKEGTKDYEHQILSWEDFVFPNITEQLTRVYLEEQPLFRFTYSSTNILYISAWQNTYSANSRKGNAPGVGGISKQAQEKSKKGDNQFLKEVNLEFMLRNKERTKQKSSTRHIRKLSSSSKDKNKFEVNRDEYLFAPDKVIEMQGQYSKVHSSKRVMSQNRLKQLSKEFERLKKLTKKV